jgi:hypothetical protein
LWGMILTFDIWLGVQDVILEGYSWSEWSTISGWRVSNLLALFAAGPPLARRRILVRLTRKLMPGASEFGPGSIIQFPHPRHLGRINRLRWRLDRTRVQDTSAQAEHLSAPPAIGQAAAQLLRATLRNPCWPRRGTSSHSTMQFAKAACRWPRN